MPATASACAVVIFGASGDLAHRKLIPAIYDLARDRLLSESAYILGYSRSAMSNEQFRDQCRQAVSEHARADLDEALWRGLEQRLYYEQADYGSDDDHTRVASRLAELDKKHGNHENHRLFYLATPPSAFEQIITRLGNKHLVEHCHLNPTRWERIIIEKPFGRDLASAKALNGLLLKDFDEEQIFRIDHYLGKETVQNLMVLRFANSTLEPIWNYKYIDHIQITVSETLGVGERGGYYDKSGALRDMVQNHLFQLMALVAMEPPAALNAKSIRDEKVKVFRSVRTIRPADVDHATVRGQYGPGEHAGQKTDGYTHEQRVPADSRTETFAAVKLLVDNWRWSGMPFYLRTGKCLQEKLSEVVVRFRSPPQTLFQKQCESPVYPNDMIIRVQPDEGVSWRVNGKVPGSAMNIKPVAMDFSYKTTFNVEPPEAYERLIYDAMVGDQTLFIRGDEAEAAWALIDPIEEGWSRSRHAPRAYAPGSWGPKEAMELIELDGRRWLHSNGMPEPIVACSL